jgi:flagellar export protein FliJ
MDASRRRQYAALLRVRRTQEDVEAQKLADVRRLVLRAQQELASIQEHQRAAIESAAQASAPKPNPVRIDSFLQYERHLNREAVNKDAEIRTLDAKAEAQRRDLEDAMKRRKTMEKLIERADEEIAVERRRREQRLTDDIAGIRHHLGGVRDGV